MRFSNELPSDYREAYVNKSFAETYRVGEIYDISVDDHGDAYDGKVKILGYLNGKDYYVFSAEISISELYRCSCAMNCRNLRACRAGYSSMIKAWISIEIWDSRR